MTLGSGECAFLYNRSSSPKNTPRRVAITSNLSRKDSGVTLTQGILCRHKTGHDVHFLCTIAARHRCAEPNLSTCMDSDHPLRHESRNIVSDKLFKALLVTIAMLLGLLAALVAGILAHADGHSVPAAIRTGAATFAATVTLTIAVSIAVDLL